MNQNPIAQILALACMTAVGACRADDWPQWRGPNRDGAWRETGIVKSLPPDGLKARWRAPVGWGWSSPAVALGRVYVSDAQLARPKARERVLCFEEATGKSLWTHAYDVAYPEWAFTRGQEGRPTATPVVQNGRVYTVGNKGDLFCLDARKGGVLWQRNLEREYRVQEFGFRASPLIEGELLILCIGSFPEPMASSVLALDRNSGKEVWRTPTDGLTNSSPLAITAGGKRQVIVWTQGSVTSLDPTDGKAFWRAKFPTSTETAIATPVFHNNHLLIGGLMLKLDAAKPAATLLWPAAKAASQRILSNTSTALFMDDYVYSARSSGVLACLDASTGKELWQTDKVTDLKSGASIHLTPNADSVFLYTDKGELILAHLSRDGYNEIGRTRLVQPTAVFAGRKVAWAAPAYANRHVFARNDEELVCVSLAAKP